MFLLSFTTTLVFFLLAEHSVLTSLAASCIRNYTVKAGDYCDRISASTNVSTYQLAAINPQINHACSNLMPGETLCLGTEGEDCTTTHVVVPGDTCERVQQNARINSTVFFLNNPQVHHDCLNLYYGEVVCIAPSVIIPASQPSSEADATSPDDDSNLPYCDEL